VKVSHNKQKQNVVSFYCLTDYEDWKNETEEKGELHHWKIKYYKGLGTSTSNEAQEYFKKMQLVTYTYADKSDDAIDLAFNKKKADDRKAWLSNYDKTKVLDYNDKEVSYEDFIHKELIHFSNYDVERSIPNMVDGMKISQRKILVWMFQEEFDRQRNSCCTTGGLCQ
jgi:DNA topoisomerase II